MEQIAVAVEREKEKEFREVKQLGYQPEWTYDGKLSNLPLPKPFRSRPRLGARHLIKCHFYKLAPAINRELRDRISGKSRYRALQLLEYSLFDSE